MRARLMEGALGGLAKRFAPLLALAAIAVIAWRTGLIGLATPRGLHAHQAAIEGFLHGHPVLALAGFILIYAALTASCLPLALTSTLTAGALFGLWAGTAASLAGGAIGAMITYSAARFAALGAGGASEGRVGQAVEAIREDAFPLVLAGRLFPFMPFAVVNIAAGLAAAPVRAFLPATVLGSIPSAMIYSSLGDRFGHVMLAGHWPDLSLMRQPGVLLPLIGVALLSLAGAVVKHRLGKAKTRA